jgi:hypothetical protein
MRRGCGTEMTCGRADAVRHDGFFLWSLTDTPSYGRDSGTLWTVKTTIKNNGLPVRCDDAPLPATAKSYTVSGYVEDVAKMHYMSFDGDLRADIDE